MRLVSLDAPERQFVDFCALRTLFGLRWDCALGVALTADRERRARLGVNDGGLPSRRDCQEAGYRFDPCLQAVDVILRALPLEL